MSDFVALNDTGDNDKGFDHYSKTFAADPLKVARELNRRGITRSEFHDGFYVLGRYDDVRRAELTPKVFRSGRPADEPDMAGIFIPSSYHGLPVIPAETDGKEHRDLRRAMLPDFTREAALKWRHRFEYWSTVFLDEAIATGSIDFAADFANPVSFIFANEFIGLPVEDWRKWQEPAHLVIFAPPGSEQLRYSTEKWAENLAELKELVRERRNHPQNDFISRMGATLVDGEPLSEDDVVALCVIVMLGAVDTTSALITNALAYLDEHPEEREALVNDEEYLVNAIEEWLRYYTPNHGQGRTVAVDTELGGCPMRRGDRIMLSFVSANHDPAKFEDPGTVKLDRSPNPHVAFGQGVHKCVGLHFARMEARVMIKDVLQRMPDYKLRREEIVPLPNAAQVTGHLRLPAEFTPGKRVQGDRIPVETVQPERTS